MSLVRCSAILGLTSCLLFSAPTEGELPIPVIANRPELVHLRQPGQVYAVAFSPDSKLLATAGWDKIIRLWDVANGQEVRQLPGHLFITTCVAFSPDGRMLASAGSVGDSTIRLWDVATGQAVRVLGAHEGGIKSLAFSPDGTAVASAAGGSVRLWDVAKVQRLREWVHPLAVDCVAFAPDAKTVASGWGDGIVRLWDVATGQEASQLKGHACPVRSLAYSADGKILASGGEGDGVICLWEVATGEQRGRWVGHSSVWFSLAYASGGRMLAAAGGGAVFHCDVTTGKQVRRVEQNGSRAVAFSPDGTLLACSGFASVAIVRDISPAAGAAGSGQLGPAQLNAFWEDLVGEDASEAHRAIWALAGAPEQAIPFLKERLRPAPAPDLQRIRRLTAELDSDRFPLRQKAAVELAALGELASPALREALARGCSLEMRRSIEQLLEKARRAPRQLRALRAVEVLEYIGNADARRTLETLAGEAAGTAQAKEARAALNRLARRSAEAARR